MRPTLRCVLLFAAGVPVALLPAIVSARLWTVWLAYTGVALFLTGVDALLALPRRRLEVATAAPDTLFIGARAATAGDDADDDALVVDLVTPRFAAGRASSCSATWTRCCWRNQRST